MALSLTRSAARTPPHWQCDATSNTCIAQERCLSGGGLSNHDWNGPGQAERQAYRQATQTHPVESDSGVFQD